VGTMRQVCSTAEVPEPDRLAYWVDAVCGTFIHLDCEPMRDRLFFGEISSSAAGPIKVGTVRSTAQRLTRSARQIAHYTEDVFNIGIQQTGHGLMSQDGHQVLLRPGDFVLHDSTRPWELTFDRNFCQVVLQVPRTALLRRLGTDRDLSALRIDGTSGLGGILSAVLRELPSRIETIPADTRARLGENLLDLIATALLPQTHPATPRSAAMTLARVKLWIETHLAEELTAEGIATRCGVSARHLNRLFGREETSLMRYVWQRRLTRCHNELADPAKCGHPITHLAFAAGFNDLSHFSRSYRARYGCAPSDTRRIG
jgi:AraC-like DNA-binding protein